MAGKILPATRERRRSYRTLVSRPVEVAWHLGDGTYVTRQAQTELVSAHGALLLMRESMPARITVALRCRPEAAWEIARVVESFLPRPDGWTPVAIELTAPNEAAWGVMSWSAV